MAWVTCMPYHGPQYTYFKMRLLGLLLLTASAPVMFDEALPLNPFHLSFVILKNMKCVYKVL